MVDRRGLQKNRPKMEKRKQQDEKKVTGRRQKGRHKKNAKKRASGNIQTQTRYTRATHGPKMEEIDNPHNE
jgi:hypothetical protein